MDTQNDAHSLLFLSAAQRGIWFAQQFGSPDSIFNLAESIEIHGAVDPALFAAALRRAVAEADTVRTRFIETHEGPRQLIRPSIEIGIPFIDVSAEADPRAAAERWMMAELAGPVALSAGPLWASALFKAAPDRFFWYHRSHHIVMDGFTGGLFARRVAGLYSAFAENRAPDASPFEPLDLLLEEEAAYRSSDRFTRDRSYWINAFADRPEPLSLARQPSPNVGGLFRRTAHLAAGTVSALRAAAQGLGASLPQMLIAATAAYLYRATSVEDLVIGMPVTARMNERLRRVPGMTANAVPLRLAMRPEMSFRELVAQAGKQIRRALRHQCYRYEDLRRDLNLLAGNQQLFSTVINIEPFDYDLRFAGHPVTLHNLSNGTADDLAIFVYDRGDGRGLRIDFDANPAIYSPDELIGHQRRLLRLLDAAGAAPDCPIGRLQTLDESERRQLLVGWNETARAVPEATLPALIEAQAARAPDSAAIIAEADTLTYAALNSEANRLAHRLIAQGAGPDTIVALAVPRSADMVVALVAILKTGAAYLPIDPDYPAERIAFTLEDARPTLIVTTAALTPRLPDGAPRLVLDAAETIAALRHGRADDPRQSERRRPLSPVDPAYVIYTSGSTGRPKGVVVAHAAIANRLLWMQATYQLATEDRVLQKTPTGFDVSVWELFWPLIAGAALVVAKPEGHKDPAYLAAVIREQRVTTVHFVPSMLQAFLRTPGAAGCTGLRRVICSGEALPPMLEEEFFATLDVPLHNLYGPTEAAIDVSAWECRTGNDSASVPIGRPIWNTALYILDGGLEPVPVGGAGELYIAGRGLARGYLNRADLAAERFVANPFGLPGTRLYRTGDLARRREDGAIEFLGRIDHQVKLRGFRVELGEIEAALTQCPGVERAVVIAREDHAGDKRLVAYVVPQPGGSLDSARLGRQLAQTLPDHMIPSAFRMLDALPLSPNGKLDRKALPAPERQVTAEYVAPRTATERRLADLWIETFGIERVGIHDNFFELGGDSLRVTHLVAKIRAAFAVELPLATLFEVSTIAGLAERLDQAQEARPPLRPQERPRDIPLSFAQQRLWFLHQLEGSSATYNITLGLRLSGRLDRVALAAALADLVERHESLRTVFPESAGVPCQLVLAPSAARPDLAVRAVTEATLPDALAAAATYGFDLTREPPVRATLFALDETQHVLLLLVHHIAGDGGSLAPLARDLAAAYAARRRGTPPDWAKLPVQYADYTLWQRALLGSAEDPDSMMARQLAFWRETLGDLPAQLALPTDHPRPAVPSYRGASVPLRLAPELHRRLAALARNRQASLFMVLAAALAALLTRHGAGTDIPIGSPIAGRTDPALEPLIGFFVNTLVLRTDTSGDPSFGALIERVRDASLAAYARQDVPFERLVESLNPARSRARHPLFQVMLAFQNTAGIELEMPDLAIRSEPVELNVAKFDLCLILGERHAADGTPDGVAGAIEFRTDLFRPETVEVLARRLLRLLDAAGAAPDCPIGRLAMLDEGVRQQLLVGWNETACAVPETTLSALIEAQAARDPQAAAIIAGADRLSYAALNSEANRLAHRLIAEGAGPDTIVALAVPRSAAMVVALVAILKTGAAYLPVDPDYPAERIAFILEDARPALIVTTAALAPCLPDVAPRLVLEAAETIASLSHSRADDPRQADRRRPLSPLDPAYLIYTSGSTGRPKGVIVPHLGIASLVATQIERFALTPQARVLQFSSASFDASIMELLMALPAGAALVLPPAGKLAGDALAEILERHQVSHALLPPAVLATLPPDAGSHLRCLIVGGDACPPELVARWSAGRRMVNAYGPTEATICATVSEPLSGAAKPPLGAPVANVRLYVLDDGMQPAPPGVAAELYIAGSGVAHGYLNRPDLTAERFVANPFGPPGSRLYRTGDLVRRHLDGELEFVGRADHQVKIRGFRIEPGEIEARLASHPDVREAAVIAREDRLGEKRLVAYAVATVGATLEPLELRRHLEKLLPDYMVPAAFVMLDQLPLTPSGKLDRKALPVAEAPPAARWRAPRTQQEERLCALFAEALGLPRVGIDDNFFELGGHSLLAIGLGRRIRDVLKPDFPLTGVYTAPVVRDLAALLEDGAATDETPDLCREVDQVPPIRLTAASSSAPSGAPRRIFLTGATGFVGSHLLAALLRDGDARITCHVRAADEASARARLRNALARRQMAGAWKDDRVDVLTGDLAAAELGLDDRACRFVREECDAIYHCGAQVDFLHPYAALKRANVESVRTLLDWTARGRPKSFHHVSTMSVIDSGNSVAPVCEQSELSAWRGLIGGYSQSKWVGDTLARRAQANGLPVAVYRLGAVTGDCTHAICNETDLIWRLARIYAALEAMPDLDLPLHMTPADDVAHAIFLLSQDGAAAGGVYHLLSSEEPSLGQVGSVFARLGLPLELVALDRWMSLARRRLLERYDDGLAAVVSILAKHDGRASHASILADATRRRLAALGGSIRPVTPALLERYLLNLRLRESFPDAVIHVARDEPAAAAPGRQDPGPVHRAPSRTRVD